MPELKWIISGYVIGVLGCVDMQQTVKTNMLKYTMDQPTDMDDLQFKKFHSFHSGVKLLNKYSFYLLQFLIFRFEHNG